MGRGRWGRVIRQYGEWSRHLGQVQNNSTLGYFTKQPRAAALTSTLPSLRLVDHLIRSFVMYSCFSRMQSDTSVS
jgi:hypothetical protein